MADRSGYIGRAPSDSSVIVSKQIFNPTGLTTEFTFSSGYVVGYLDLYMNGVRLLELNDYTAHDGNTITLTSPATLGDTIEAVAYKAFSATTVSFASGGFSVGADLSVTNNVSVGGSITAGTLYGDGSNLTGIDATALKDSSNTVRVQANTDGAEVTGVLTATSLSAQSALIGTGVTLNSSGINVGVLTATDAFFSDVSIGGTITNIDSVGVVTAQSGIKVGAGQSIGPVSGIITYYGDGSQLSNISSLKDSTDVKVQATPTGAVVTGILTATSVKVGAGITLDGTSGITLDEATTASQIINPVLVNYAEKVNTMGVLGAVETIDVADGTYVTATLSTNATTINFASPPSGKLYGFSLALTNASSGGAVTISWNTGGTGVKWPGGNVPLRTQDPSKTDIWSFFTSDGGTNWYGALTLFNFS